MTNEYKGYLIAGGKTFLGSIALMILYAIFDPKKLVEEIMVSDLLRSRLGLLIFTHLEITIFWGCYSLGDAIISVLSYLYKKLKEEKETQ